MNAWSARSLGRSAPPDTDCYWLTAAAVDRVESAIAHGTLDFSDIPPMADNLVIGLAKPLSRQVVGEGKRAEWFSIPVTTIVSLADTNGRFRGMRLISLGYGGIGPSAVGALYCLRRNDYRGLIHSCVLADRVAADAKRTFGEYPLTAFGEGAEYAAQFLRAAWLLINSETERDVSATELDQAVPRVRTAHHRRSDDVAVLDVRRPAPVRRAGSCGRVVEHDHRWTRRGHWRMQPYGAGNAQRRRIWIEPQVCGPADKPLLVRPKVSVLR